MIIVPVQQAYVGRVFGAVAQTGQSVKFSGSGFLFGGRRWFRRFRRFHLFLGRPLFPFLLQQSLLIPDVPRVFQLSCFLRIFVRHFSNVTDVCSDGQTLSKVLSANHRSRSRPRGDGRSLYPWGGPPSIFFWSIKPPHLTLT